MPAARRSTFILGAGVTGLAAGCESGLPVFEATLHPGGICSSYYLYPGARERLHHPPADGEAYRFEIGGGHWIFGGEPELLTQLERLAPMRRYERRSAVYLPDVGGLVPYPLQNHLHALGPEIASRALAEIQRAGPGAPRTLKEWLEARFGPSLGELFFQPFHDRYTAGWTAEIAPQDPHKSPLDLGVVARGARGPADVGAGYNVTFLYPRDGLDALTRALAERCEVHYGRAAARIDPQARRVHFEDGGARDYDRLVSSLPLHRTLEMAGLTVADGPFPSTAVLVLNLGARKGPRCPSEHWVYVPHSASGFHRVGFYSNVDTGFLPRSARAEGRRVAVYVELSCRDGELPEGRVLEERTAAVIAELRGWGWIDEVEVVDATRIEVAYTWSLPGNGWREQAIEALERAGIHPVGRYGRWRFQGIADSIRDGLEAGRAFGRGAEGAPR